MSTDHRASDRNRLRIAQRSLAGRADRERLEELLKRFESDIKCSSWKILPLEASDPLREMLLIGYRDRQRSGELRSRELSSPDELRSQLGELFSGFAPDQLAFVNFQRSEYIGLLQISVRDLHPIAVDLLIYDGDTILISAADSTWGLLLDQGMQDENQLYEIEAWGIAGSGILL